MPLFPEVAMPKLPSCEVIAINPGGTERGDNPLAVRDGGTGAIKIGLMCWFLLRRGDAGLPEHFSVGAVKTNDRAVVFDGLSQEHTVAPNHRRGIARFRQRCFPADIPI